MYKSNKKLGNKLSFTIAATVSMAITISLVSCTMEKTTQLRVQATVDTDVSRGNNRKESSGFVWLRKSKKGLVSTLM